MIQIRDLINQALDEEMDLNSNIYILGEEVGKSGGPHGISKNLIKKYGRKRVLDTPISEMGFTGLAVGSGYLGLRPVVDFMTWNFALQSIDHIINSCAKTLYMSGGQVRCPIVFRGPNGFNSGYSAQHTQDFSAYYGSIPGLKVVCPYTGKDHKGLLKSAIRDNNPVVYLENEMLYSDMYHEVDSEYTQPLDKCVVEKGGRDVTVLGISLSLREIFSADKILEDLNVSCEIINLVSVRPVDYDTIVQSVCKTKKIVIVDFSFPQYGVASELSACLYDKCYEVLDKPILRLMGKDVPTPYASNLEKKAFPSSEDVVEAVRKICEK
jgi:pyruvate dehydrogenase E1 component beta subunit